MTTEPPAPQRGDSRTDGVPTPADDLSGMAIRGTAVTAGAQLMRVALQFGSVLVLARLLVPEDFGLVAMVTAVIGVAELLRDFGLSAAVVQAETVSRDERTNLFWANTALGVGCAVFALALTPVIVAIYGEPRLQAIVPALAGVFVLSGLGSQYRAGLTRDLRFGQVALADLIAQGIGAGMAIGAASLGAGFWALVLQQIAVALTTLLVNAVNARWLPGLPVRGVSIRRFIGYGRGFLGTQLLIYVTTNIDNVVIGAVWGKAVLGLYSRAYQLLMLPLNQINAPLTRVALPVFSRVQKDKPTLTRYCLKAQLVVCYVTMPLLTVAAALAWPAIEVLFGPGWEGAAPIFAILALGGIFRAISSLAYWMFLAQALTDELFRLQLWTRPLMVGLIVAGLPWGAEGVAVGHLVAYAGYWVVSLIRVGRLTGIPVAPFFITSVRAMLAFTAPAAAAAWLASQSAETAVLQLALGLIAACFAGGLAWLVVPPVRRDLAVLVKQLRRVRRRPALARTRR